MEDNIVEILKTDYQQFPQNQTYSIYAEDVYFEDPMNKFRGIERYQQMIGFMEKWFLDVQLDLHQITRSENIIKTEWTLSWTTPLPWQPRISIPGWSQLTLNREGKINSHIDYWNCSKLDVLQQLFKLKTR